MKNSLFSYVSDNNPRAAYDLLLNKGYHSMPKDKSYITMGLADYVNKDKEAALIEIAKIHPDKELFEILPFKSSIMKSIEKNCEGCPSSNTINADGDPVVEESKNFSVSENTLKILIASSTVVFIFTALALTIRKIK
jgi:hypothetical protein